nr:hypothetical protein [Tanacetum cinerariifolium]
MLEDPYVEVALHAPPSPDYIPGPEEPEQVPPSPDYVPVPGPKHANDEIVAEDRPYAEDALPNAQSPEYVPVSDLDVHPEDDDDEDPEEDPVDYLADGGDDGDDEEGSSEDDEDNDKDIEADEEEEEEHPAPADSIVVASTATDQAPSAEETEPFEIDESAATPPPHPAYRMITRISIPAPAASTSHSPPLPPPFILSPTRSDAPSSGTPLLLPISASTSSPTLQLPSASRREDKPEVTLPPRKKLAGGLRADYGFVATMDREIMHDPEREVGYGITNSWDEIVEALQGAPVNASDLVRGEVMSLCTTVLGQITEIRKLHAADRKRQTMILEMLRAYHMKSTEDSPTWTCNSFTGTGYRITGTTGTRW